MWDVFFDFLGNFTLAMGSLLLGVFLGLFLVLLPTELACRIVTIFPRNNKRIWRLLFSGIAWRLYRRKSNAVVLREIGDCAPFLDLHFSNGVKGEIWLYNTDLTAFADKELYKQLYQNIVFPRANITSVKIVFDKNCKAKLSAINKGVWRNIRDTLCGGEFRDRAKIVQYMFLEEPLEPKFERFISDEAYVFYTRGDSLHGPEALCVYRRFNGQMHVATDDRVILLGSRRGRHLDPLNVFMPTEIMNKFTEIFMHTESEKWNTLASLAEGWAV